MRLGLLTAPFPDTPLMEVADWTAANGFESLEIACWPRSSGPTRRYAGTSHIDVVGLTAAQGSEIVDEITAKGLAISGLGYYPNPLHPDLEHRAMVIDHLKAVMRAAEAMGIGLVNTFMGGDKAKHVDDNWVVALEVWPDIVRYAQDHGVKVTIENCPMIFSYDEWPGGVNLAYSPAIWRELFEAIPSGSFGLNLDPSHLVWQMIDYERVVYDFADRIFHVHAKDLEVRKDGLYEHGVMSLGMGWQVPRIPGLGEVRWDRFLAALHGAGYDGPVVIEHEDRAFEATEELVIRGFHIARDVLRPYVR